MINIKVTNPFYDKTYEISTNINEDELIKNLKSALCGGNPINFIN